MGYDDFDKYTKTEEAFIDWLTSEGYEPAIECCPIDDGELMFATDTYDLLDDYLSENPQPNEKEEELRKFALFDGYWGQVSNAFNEPEDDVPEDDVSQL